jgi:phosphoribosylformimino-5-aminoimidazole carboxamide ribotide isomerase
MSHPRITVTVSPVRIIGVIDLKEGQAVHARGGRRELYTPVRQSAGVMVNGDPMALARVYVGTFGLSEIYVADLDAIGSHTLQADVIRDLSMVGASLWVDAGFAQADETPAALEAGAATIVVGLETLASFEALADICAHTTPVAFSLDLRSGTPMNTEPATQSPEALARQAVDAGAKTVIVLDVARVGVAGGPDFDLLGRIRSAVPDVELLAGGGVRGLDDLEQLVRIGCAGALVATALHEGHLTRTDVATAGGF